MLRFEQFLGDQGRPFIRPGLLHELVHIAIKRSVACALHSLNNFQCCFPGQLLFRDDAATKCA